MTYKEIEQYSGADYRVGDLGLRGLGLIEVYLPQPLEVSQRFLNCQSLLHDCFLEGRMLRK